MSSLDSNTNLSDYQRYLREHFHHNDDALAELQAAAVSAGLPQISIGPEQGKFLQLLVALTGARKILEIGTLGGYSGAWMARALPAGGRLISLELEPQHAEVARRQWARLGLAEKAEIRVGPALETLPRLQDEAPFDMIFIDADKVSYPTYLEWALKLSRPGSAIVADNIEQHGRTVDPDSQYLESVQQVRRFVDLLSTHPRLVSTVVPYADGLAVAVVRNHQEET